MSAPSNNNPSKGGELELTADCMRCVGLCCVGLAFYECDYFSFEKEAGTPCHHLTGENLCGVHDSLIERGLRGCVAFDCLGAGQRVCQEVFPGRSWRDDPATAHAMFEALRPMRKIHELVQLLQTAAALDLTPEQATERGALEAALTPADGWTEQSLAEFDRGDMAARVGDYLKSLKASAR